MDVYQGEIYWVTIHPSETKGSEQDGRRPFLIVSRNAVNKSVKTVVAVPMSTKVEHQPAHRVVIPVGEITKDVSCNSVLELSVAKTTKSALLTRAALNKE